MERLAGEGEHMVQESADLVLERQALRDALLAALASDDLQAVRAALSGVAEAPVSADGWFDVCMRFKYDAEIPGLFQRWRDAVLPTCAPTAFERYVILNTFLVGCEKMQRAPAPESIKRIFREMVSQIAARDPRWDQYLDYDGRLFYHLARLACVERFNAGEMSFEFDKRLPLNFLFRMNPIQAPIFLAYCMFIMRGRASVFSFAFNYVRDNRLILPQKDFERTLWRAAKMLEMHPAVDGLLSAAWFHSAATAAAFPRLAWMRTLFAENGAFLIDLERGYEQDITYNSAQRRKLFDEGKFVPRHTVMLWSRKAVLRWAASRADIADADDEPIAAPAKPDPVRIASPAPQPPTPTNSKLQLWDGIAWRNRYGSKYWAAVLGAPSTFVAILIASLLGRLWALPAFGLTGVAMLFVQYFMSQ